MPIDIDNTDVSDITIDGQNVSEVTADGNVVWNAIPDSVVYDFETGDVSQWDDVNDLTPVSDRTNTGTYAGYCGTGQSGTHQAYARPYDGDGVQITSFEYYWQESSNSSGSGIRLINSNGNVEVGTASDNPQWNIDDGDGVNEVRNYQANSYNIWTRFTLTFDWDAGTFSVDFERPSTGQNYTDTGRPLKQGVDIARVQIDDFSTGAWQTGFEVDSWFDDITVES